MKYWWEEVQLILRRADTSAKSKDEKHLKSFLQTVLIFIQTKSTSLILVTLDNFSFLAFWQEVKQVHGRMSPNRWYELMNMNSGVSSDSVNSEHVLTFLLSPADRVFACLFKWSFSSRAFTTLTTTRLVKNGQQLLYLLPHYEKNLRLNKKSVFKIRK